jgi:hypothetical protein
VLAHGGGERGHDCEVVTGAASEELESSVVESSVVALSVVDVAAAVELWVEAVVVDFADVPIGPLKAITPHARANEASVPATTRRRR